MAEKVTTMVLKVDLQCPKCYRKVKKVLAEFPQIRDQAYDEKQNTVTITVVSSSPEKVRDKLCCKGGKAIKSIEIKEPPKPKGKPEPKPEPDKAKEKSERKPEETPPAPNPALASLVYVPVPGYPSMYPICYGPCYEGYGRPVPSYDGYGYPYGGNRVYNVSRCDEYFNEENTSGCRVM